MIFLQMHQIQHDLWWFDTPIVQEPAGFYLTEKVHVSDGTLKFDRLQKLRDGETKMGVAQSISNTK